MCGIVGHIDLRKSASLQEITAACDRLKHRGPDAYGAVKINENIAFGHTRLSFLDLSDSGSQPMFSTNKNLCITFNGEIYNYLELKEELASDYNFIGGSDTEVILAAYQKWGIKMLDKLIGMFAFALYDQNSGSMFLARDRFGIKPLYYNISNNHLTFCSELKALPCFKSFKKEMDWSAFCDYFVYRYIPSPKTIWENTFKLPPASYLEINVNSLQKKETEYWTPYSSEQKISEEELIKFVGDNLQESVKQHAVADVPIGAFLSGGYDSSAIVNLLHKTGNSPNTFSIGFENWENSEDYFAEMVANHLAVRNEKVVADETSLRLIKKMPQVYDEPIADISIIPTYLVSELASKSRKAVMGGEGADEIFVGYHWQKEFYNKSYPKDLVGKIKHFFQKQDTVGFYAKAMAMGWFDADELKKMLTPQFHKYIPQDVHWFYRKHYKKNWSPLKSIQYLDMKCFMSELVLVKVDRASMANSLEVRVPFLNQQLYEKVFSSNEKLYFKKDVTKYLLFENIKKDLPKEILQRNKQGFVGPDSYYMNKAWYRKELKDSCLVEHGVINKSYINQLLEKEYDWRIWKILVMEKWFKEWMS